MTLNREPCQIEFWVLSESYRMEQKNDSFGTTFLKKYLTWTYLYKVSYLGNILPILQKTVSAAHM